MYIIMLLQIPAKGAKGLVIAAVTLMIKSLFISDQTLNSSIQLIFHIFATFFAIDEITDVISSCVYVCVCVCVCVCVREILLIISKYLHLVLA